MLKSIINNLPHGDWILYWIEWAALVIEVLAVLIILGVIITSLSSYVARSIFKPKQDDYYQILKHRLGRGLLLGLEILVAADIVHTVALETTLESVAVLGLLVLIRTFLSWALVVEMEERWPWQAPRK